MIKLVAFYEKGWLDANTDWRQWDHLARAFDVDLQMIKDWSDVTIPDKHQIVIVDEEGEQEHTSATIPEDSVLVFGRTGMRLTSLLYDLSIRIDTPSPVCLFGVEAAAIILAKLQWK